METREYLSRQLIGLGATMRYRGYNQAICAAELAITDTENLTLISKRIYPTVAKLYGAPQYVVERNIRTLIDVIWKTNPDGLCLIAGCPLPRKPTVSDFISILANDAMRNASRTIIKFEEEPRYS